MLTQSQTPNAPATPQAQATDNTPDWVVKSPRGSGKYSKLERVGAAWNRVDGGIGIRLIGKQIVEDDLYLYPYETQD